MPSTSPPGGNLETFPADGCFRGFGGGRVRYYRTRVDARERILRPENIRGIRRHRFSPCVDTLFDSALTGLPNKGHTPHLMGLKNTEAIVLHTLKLGEADRIVVLFTRDSGVVRATARGARKLKSRFGASLEPFTHIRLSYFEKENRELVSLSDTEIVRSYFSLLKEETIFTLLEYLGGLLLEFSPPHEPNEKLFRMSAACLEGLSQAPENRQGFASYFEIWTLKLSGFLPDLKNCGSCARALSEVPGRVHVGPSGNLLCNPCGDGKGFSLSHTAWSELKAALSQPPLIWARELELVPKGTSAEVQAFTRQSITRALERPPRGRRNFGEST
ncbi:MAG: DNA repair protein RecO [Rubrivivax sp.]|nr:DNA repair protein RecO [Pyrinomonadaceae bacterium]